MSSIGHIQSMLDAGNCLAAYDAAQALMKSGELSPRVKYLRVLALTQTGALRAALDEYEQLNLAATADVDTRALLARIFKDLGHSRLSTQDRDHYLRLAAEAYRKIFMDTDDYFPGINAASLLYRLGDRVDAHDLASHVSDLAAKNMVSYWSLATRAEACFIMGEGVRGLEFLRKAMSGDDIALRWRASTYNNIANLLNTGATQEALLRDVRNIFCIPNVATFCGHMFNYPDGDVTRSAEKELKQLACRFIKDHNIGILYGALACGADTIIAETALSCGVAVHIILPFLEDDFIELSVLPGGKEWLPRYEAVKRSAASFVLATDHNYIDDPWQFKFGSIHMQGMAMMKAAQLKCQAIQLAVWDGNSGSGPAGTGPDIELWREAGRITKTIPLGAFDRQLKRPEPQNIGLVRQFRAVLFADFEGFSKLKDIHYPYYINTILQACADICDEYNKNICAMNTWGDALFIVFDDVEAAAGLALNLESKMIEVIAASDLSEIMGGIRISVHYGPVVDTLDPITKKENFFGAFVSEAARIEPVTPTGAVFVSESFACALTLKPKTTYEVGFVGTIRLAKNYGARRLYQLR